MCRVNQKTFLVNAITVKEGGGAVVFTHTFNEIQKISHDVRWIVVLDEVLRDQIDIHPNTTILSFPWIKKSPFHFLYWNEIYFPRLIRKMKVDVVFSQTNTLPFKKLPCPTLLSQLNAGYFSSEFIALNAKYNTAYRNKIGWAIRKQWVFSSIKKADKVTTPTQALGNDIASQLSISANKIVVIHPGTGLAEGQSRPRNRGNHQTWRIGYITKYGVQKNFDVLFKAAAALKAKKIDFKLVLTLNTDHAPFKQVNSLIQKYDIVDIIENHGEIAKDQIQALYDTLDLFIFPSLCESIGFTLMEAMHYGLPIIAADINSNREFLGEKGMFFERHDHHQLADKIMSVINSGNYVELSRYSISRSQLFSWKTFAKHTLDALRELSRKVI